MTNIVLALFLLCIKVNNSYETNINNQEKENYDIVTIEPGSSNTTFIKYL